MVLRERFAELYLFQRRLLAVCYEVLDSLKDFRAGERRQITREEKDQSLQLGHVGRTRDKFHYFYAVWVLTLQQYGLHGNLYYSSATLDLFIQFPT